MSAIRLARGFTGRAKIVKFAGCYHGHVDALLADAGSGVATLGLPYVARRHRRRGRRHDRAALQRHRRGRGGLRRSSATRSPASSPRPAPATWAPSPPLPGFNAALRRVTAEHGALLIIDEVMTGFRVSRSGWYGLDPRRRRPVHLRQGDERRLPAAAFGGRAEVMARLAPLGPVYQAGTLSGNPVAMAAGPRHAAGRRRRRIRPLDANADRLARLLTAALTEAGVAHQVQRAGNMFSVFFADGPVHRLRGAKAHRDVALPRRSSTPCSTRASTRRPARSRHGSSRLPRRRRVRPHRRRAARRRPCRRGSEPTRHDRHDRARRSCT